MQTHLVSKIMHQNIAVILRQFNYGKISFIVLDPDVYSKTVNNNLMEFFVFKKLGNPQLLFNLFS